MSRLTEADFVEIVGVALPRLGLDWRGYRRLKNTLRKRLSRRLSELGLHTAHDYLAYLEAHPEEWQRLDASCRMSISRFYRDAEIFDRLSYEILPLLAARASAAGRRRLAVWSAGCASGEEPYSLALAWQFAVGSTYPDLGLDILATDADCHLLERAEQALYAGATLRELPEAWRSQGFEPVGALLRLKEPLRRYVRFEPRDSRDSAPAGPFDLVLCRNSAFTYFDAALQRAAALRIWERLTEGGVLVLGAGEVLPEGAGSWSEPSDGLYTKLT